MAVSGPNRQPGVGIIGSAEEFGPIPADAPKDDRLAFWSAERNRVYEERSA